MLGIKYYPEAAKTISRYTLFIDLFRGKQARLANLTTNTVSSLALAVTGRATGKEPSTNTVA